MQKYRIVFATVFMLALTSLSAMAQSATFNMVPSSSALAAGCIAKASGRVTIHSIGNAENLHLEVSGLPANTGFDFFVIQLPNAPFGLSWYQGDLTTDGSGRGVADFTGRFSIETFIVAPGSGVAPVVFPGDVNTNPATGPVHQYHLGLWFNSPNDAAAAGCPNNVTPFNGEHNAGIQALSTRNFGDLVGPLKKIH